MKEPRYDYNQTPVPEHHYQRALVPEHLTKLTIEKLGLGEVYYVSPGERDGYEPCPIFVSQDRELKMMKSHAIDLDDRNPTSPIGLIGIMHIAPMDPQTGRIRDMYIADLRFIESHQLTDTEDLNNGLVDQEEFMEMVAMQEESIRFDGFIAPELGKDMERDIPKGIFYGDPSLHPFLKKLRKKGTRLMRQFIEQQDKPQPKGKDSSEEEAVDGADKPKDTPAEPQTDASVKFSDA